MSTLQSSPFLSYFLFCSFEEHNIQISILSVQVSCANHLSWECFGPAYRLIDQRGKPCASFWCLTCKPIAIISSAPVHRRIARWNTKIQSLAGLKARGIARVPPKER